jgi:hypothetical protein
MHLSKEGGKMYTEFIWHKAVNVVGFYKHGNEPIPTGRPPLVGEVSANFYGKMVPRGRRD